MSDRLPGLPPSAVAPAHARGRSAATAAPARTGLRPLTLALLVGLVVLTVTALRLLVAEPFGIPTASMAPTLSPGDHVLVDKLAYRGSEPGVGDLAVFHAPGTDEITLKRVVARGGDTVAIEDGVLHVNGRARVEPYANPDAIDSVYFGPERVPAGSVFVLGDNRGDSFDSRRFGAVPSDRLIGRARARLWPLDDVGLLP
jgi:signal peptidase I